MSNPGKIAAAARKQPGSRDVRQMHWGTRSSPWRGFPGGFLVGAVVGVVIALLYAPRRGVETRRIVNTSAMEMTSRASEIVRQVRSEAEPVTPQSRRELTSEPAIERTFGD